MIRRGTGNLLKSPSEALVNTVNCVGVMGKGIALQFKKAWPEMYEEYRREAKAKRVRPGQIHVWSTGQVVNPRYVLNFPTKRHWRGRSKLEDIDAGLEALVLVIRELGIESIAIPPLGAGNGGLAWAEVKPRIVRAFDALPQVEVWLWEPGHTPAAEDRPNRTRRPKWTTARAAMLALMDQYRVFDEPLTQLEAQKLGYFLNFAMPDLDLSYQEHIYGPYSDGLYHMLLELEGHFLFGLQDRAPAAEMTLDSAAVQEARSVLADSAAKAFERVSDLIEGFETPYGMELLATVHWVAQRSGKADVLGPEATFEGVRDWNPRKRETMHEGHVQKAWDRLHERGWL